MVKKYPVEFEGKVAFVTVPESEEIEQPQPATTWTGGDNGPVLPEDKQPKKRSD